MHILVCQGAKLQLFTCAHNRQELACLKNISNYANFYKKIAHFLYKRVELITSWEYKPSKLRKKATNSSGFPLQDAICFMVQALFAERSLFTFARQVRCPYVCPFFFPFC